MTQLAPSRLKQNNSRGSFAATRELTLKFWPQLGLPVVLTGIILLLLLVVSIAQFRQSIVFTFTALWNIFPFIALSVVMAALLKASGANQIVAKSFIGNPVKTILIASIFGALSPFCSCGVIPIVAGLLASGVPIAPVLAFCIASPIMDPEMFVLTSAGLGLEFALYKTAAAITMGLLTGYATLFITNAGLLNDALKSIAKPSCATLPSANETESPKPVWAFWRQPDRFSLFWREALHTGWFLGRWLTFAFLIESLMVAYLPGEMIASWLGEGNPFAIPLAVLFGVPAYLNGYAAIPLVRGLIDLGMSPATGLAFMLAGSVTSIPAAIAVWTIAKPRLFVLYLVMAALGALTMGLIYAFFIAITA